MTIRIRKLTSILLCIVMVLGLMTTTAMAEIEDFVPVRSVTVLPSTLTLGPGNSTQLTAVVKPDNASFGPAVWSRESGSDKISVNPATGLVMVASDAPNGAQAVIKATAEGKSDRCTVTVDTNAYSITVNGGSAVRNGTNAASATAGTVIDLIADYPMPGLVFDGWVVVSGDVMITGPEESVALFIMPAGNVEITATYKAASDTRTKITNAGVKVTAPVDGGTPENAISLDKPVAIANTVWDPADDSFEGGKAYSVLVTLEPKADYRFTAGTTFTINGNDVEIVTRSADEAKIRFTFPITFVDVNVGAYYAPAVTWAVANNITAGTSPTTFSPEDACTRAQVVAFLWRTAGRPEPKTTSNPFTDVKSDDYFYKAVLWAVENKIVYGIDETTFSPEEDCTRAQVAAFLWRAEGTPEPKSAYCPFTDVPASAYYIKAVTWAAENKIVYGTDDTTFSPEEDCTRAQIVTFLYRAYGA